MPGLSQGAAILRRVASSPGEGGRRGHSSASAVRAGQCQPCRPSHRHGRRAFRQPRRRSILTGMSTRPRSPAGGPMTVGNMRANGVRSLYVSCWLCHHRAILAPARGPITCQRHRSGHA